MRKKKTPPRLGWVGLVDGGTAHGTITHHTPPEHAGMSSE